MNIPSEQIEQNKNKNYSNNISDIIANEMIEKIISLTISISTKKEINSKIPQKCFNFVENIINSYVSWNFITYDKDEIRSKNKTIISSNNESEIFPHNNISSISNNNNISEPNANSSISNSYFEDNKILSNSSYGKNDWDFYDEPPSNKVDKYATTLIKYISLKFDNKYQYNKSKIVKEVEEEDEVNKTKISKFRNSIKYNSKIFRNFSRFSTVKNNNNDKVPVKTKPKNLNEIMNEFSFHSIEEENLTKQLQNLDKLIHVDELRKEIDIKKDDGQKDLNIANKKRLEIINRIKLEEEKNKKYLGKNITKDHNGEIVFIKGIKLDKLKKDFFLPQTYFKSIKEKEKANLKNTELPIKNDIEKNNSIDEEKEIEKNKENENEKDKIDIIKNIKSLMKSRSKDVLYKNNLPLFNKSKSNLTSLKNDKKIIKPNKDNTNTNIIRSFVPGGSSFNLMNMEVGVTLREDNQYKSGGKDFFLKFKKYSLLNYDNQLKESLELNALKLNKPEGLNDANTNFKNFSVHKNNIRNLFLSHENSNAYLDNTSQKYKSTRSSNTMNNNSSIKNSHFLEKKTLTYAKSTSNMNVSIERIEKFKPLIMLSNGSTSLNDIFSQNDTKLNTKNIKLILKKKNIFRKSRNIKSLKNIFSLKDINNFNKAIMTNNNKFELHNLQDNHFSLSPTRKPEKPLINEIYKEIGFNKTISRNRNKILSLQKPLVLSTLNFFKQ